MDTRTNEVAIARYLRVLRRRWLLILLCFVIAAASTVAFSLLQRKEYTASAQLLFRNDTFTQQLFNTSSFNPVQDPAQEAATNQHLVQLPIVSQRTSAVLHLPAGRVAGDISVSSPGQATIAVVSATDPSPVMAAKIANTYASQYVLFRQQADRQSIAGAQLLLQKELAGLSPAQRATSQGLSLSSRSQQLQILASLQTGNAEFVQPAGAPGAPSIPKTKRNAALGAFLGLLLGIGIAFMMERLDRHIRDPAALEATFDAPLLGVIPESPAYARAPTSGLIPQAEMEAFALLRARLRYFNVDRELRTLLVTSPAPQDGKSTVSINLAFAEAAGGKRQVVLVEADLRRPTLASKLQIERYPGVAEVLSGNEVLGSALQTVPLDSHQNGDGGHFTVITSGAIPPNPAELLESRAMVDLLAQLRERFDLIVIDSPPSQSVADAMHLMPLVDGVVVVSRVGANTRDTMGHMRDQLRRLKAPVLGVVANAVPPGDAGYGQYGYYDGYAAPAPAQAEREPAI